MAIQVRINEQRTVPNKNDVVRVARKALRLAGCALPSGIISITFTDDARIRSLNKKYRFRNKATDVLSFPMNEDGLLGDIVISVPTARKNTVKFGTTFPQEILRLTVHGILHICGYTHKTRVQKSIMFDMENTVLKISGRER